MNPVQAAVILAVGVCAIVGVLSGDSAALEVACAVGVWLIVIVALWNRTGWRTR